MLGAGLRLGQRRAASTRRQLAPRWRGQGRGELPRRWRRAEGRSGRPVPGRADARARARPRRVRLAATVVLLRRPRPRRGLDDRPARGPAAARSPTTWRSLDAVAALGAALLCPGHGPWITDPAAKIAEYARAPPRARAPAGRGARRRRALDATTLLDAAWSDVPDAMRPAAALAMRAHLEKLAAEGLRLPTDLEPLAAIPPRCSRRDQIKLTPEEQLELLDSERVVIATTIGPRGWPHSMPLWFVVRDGEIWAGPSPSPRRSRTSSATRGRRCWSRPGTSTRSCAGSRSRPRRS